MVASHSVSDILHLRTLCLYVGMYVRTLWVRSSLFVAVQGPYQRHFNIIYGEPSSIYLAGISSPFPFTATVGATSNLRTVDPSRRLELVPQPAFPSLQPKQRAKLTCDNTDHWSIGPCWLLAKALRLWVKSYGTFGGSKACAGQTQQPAAPHSTTPL